jgi:hypothetical protein
VTEAVEEVLLEEEELLVAAVAVVRAQKVGRELL